MQFKKGITLTIMGILALSLFMNPSSLTLAQVEPILMTGDEFSFETYESNGFLTDRYFELYNQSNGVSLRSESEINDEWMEGDGFSDITVIVQSNPPRGIDITDSVVLVINQQLDFTGERYEERNFTNYFNPLEDESFVNSQPVTPQTKENRETVFFNSNATYPIEPLELTSNSLDVPFHPFPREFFTQIQIPMDSQATLLNRSVTNGNATYFVNNRNMFFDTINVTSEYYYSFETNFTTSIPFGDIMDPNTQFVDANATFFFDVYFYFEYVFDQNSGLLIERYSYNDFTSWMDMENLNFVEKNIGWDTGFYSGFFTSNFIELYMSISFAGSHFGNTRPSSVGANVLEEGDILNFNFNGYSSFKTDFNFANPGGAESSQTMVNAESRGEATVKVYYHEPGLIRATLENFGTVTGDFTETRNGFTSSNAFTDPFFDIDVFETLSNDSYEISPFYDQEMYIDFPWFGDMGGEEIPAFLWEYPNRLEMVSKETYTDYPFYKVNGNEYQFEAEVIEIMYEQHFVQTYFDERMQLNLNLTLEASGTFKLVYDSWTGALLEQSENIHVIASAEVLVGLSVDQVNLDLSFSFEMNEGLDIEIASHPNHFQGVQTEFPDVPEDTTADHTNSTDGSPTDDSPNISLPLPFLPTFAAIGVMVVYMRKRR